MDEGERKQRSVANAVGGSTARACDGCLRRRARWYCGADDAFLCQACDASVHSANSLARRHQRLRLHTASSSSSTNPSLPFLIQDPNDTGDTAPISWSKRKARTPRPFQQTAKLESAPKPEPLVPELDMEEEELELHLMCRVPVLDTLFTDFCSPLDENLPPPALRETDMLEYGLENFDVECLLGVELDDVNESSLYNMDGFTVVEEEDMSGIKMEIDLEAMGSCQLSSQEAMEEQLEGEGSGGLKKIGLRLDYDAVIEAWSKNSGFSPWGGGDRPQLDSESADLPASFMDTSASGMLWSRGRWGASGGEEREARVTRYREKRRTRLFAKKIRYEVRKLNAEKRPRMKGRFVKRTTLSTGSGPAYPFQ